MSEAMRMWRAACRELAQQRAREEALQLWGTPDAIPIPFDYRWEHVREVVATALHLGERFAADVEVLEAAAWLHDIRKLEKNHAVVGAAEAGSFLRSTDFPPEKIDAVVDAIAQHEGFFRADGAASLEPVEAAILWDADKLTKLGAEAVLFSFASPYVRGRNVAERFEFADSFVRTVLSRTVSSMNTPVAREIAETRYAHTLALLEMWAEELKLTSHPAV